MWAVLDYTETKVISRELLLAKVSILGSEYVEEQLVGGPSHAPRRVGEKMERETTLAHHFATSGSDAAPAPLTPSQALRVKHQHLHSISVLAQQFGAKIVDVSEHSVHCRLRGSCRKRSPCAESRVVQIGSWWETSTASWPRASARASSIAARIRAATST